MYISKKKFETFFLKYNFIINLIENISTLYYNGKRRFEIFFVCMFKMSVLLVLLLSRSSS